MNEGGQKNAKTNLCSGGGVKTSQPINRGKKTSLVIFILITLLLVVGGTFAFIQLTLTGTRNVVITAGTLSLELQEDDNNLTITDALPMYDEVGMIQDAFTFRLINNATRLTDYAIKLADITTGEKLDTSIVKYGLTKDGQTTIDLLSNLTDGIIDSGTIGTNTIEYALRLWIDSEVTDNSVISGKSLSYKIVVEAYSTTKYEITFDTDGGESISGGPYTEGATYGTLPVPEKKGYKFLGWYTSSGELVTKETMVTVLEDNTLYAKWTASEYIVTLNANGGTVETESIGAIYNSAYGSLPTPTKTNYQFLGWYTELTGGTLITKDTIYTLTEDQTLYAHWSEYEEEILNGTEPVLTSNLIPVTIASNGAVTKADINSEWYDYDNQIWANAVVLKTATTYAIGATIPESNIESYFVWIPKYSYKLWDLGNYSSATTATSKEQTIEIKFGTMNTSDSVTGECTTPAIAGASGSCGVGEYMTHPAFLAFDTTGFWVGKFEAGYNGATSTTEAQVDSSDSTKLIVKPNVYSWRNITVGNAFKVSYDYLREDESHMIKNTEWGAVAYLQHSVYGSGTSVRVNNNSAYITGYAGTEEPIVGYSATSIEGKRHESTSLNVDGIYTKRYNTTTGYLASTTGNISGVYDMSGGAWEYVMGYNTKATTDSSGITTLYSDFFTNNTWDKYYDKYNQSGTHYQNYNNRILGDAMGEMGPFGSQVDPDGATRYISSWYGDYGNFAPGFNPWFARTGDWRCGSEAGAFAFNSRTGAVHTNFSFRIVLAP